MIFYIILIALVLAATTLILIFLKGEGGSYSHRDYLKKKNNPYDNFMV